VSARNWGARTHDITLGGAPAVVLENERLRVTVLLHGAHVVECNDKRRDLDLVWLAPDGTGAGGWQEVVPNGGAPSEYAGARLGQHDEVTHLPWDAEIVADDPAEVAVRLTVRTQRLPLRLTKVLRLRSGSTRLEIDEELSNTAPVPTHAMWGQHLAFGRPFLQPGSRLRLPRGVRVRPHPVAINPPRRRVAPGGPYGWPAVPADGGGQTDLSVVPEPGGPSDIVYLAGFTAGWYELHRPDGAAVRVEWDASVLPYLWLWQELGASAGYPWWGRAYVLGIEPFSSWPTNGLAEAVANGTALALPPSARKRLTWSIGVIEDG
jgi:hypothetical protein